jgi:hypothetical protein
MRASTAFADGSEGKRCVSVFVYVLVIVYVHVNGHGHVHDQS